MRAWRGGWGRGSCGWTRTSFEPYRSGLEEGGHGRGAARLAGLANLIVADDPPAAWARLARHVEYQWNTYAYYGAEGTGRPRAERPEDGAGTRMSADRLRSRGPAMTSPNVDVVTPGEAVSRLGEWLAGLPVVEVYFWESVAAMPDDLVRRHIELLATRVRPALGSLGVPALASS